MPFYRSCYIVKFMNCDYHFTFVLQIIYLHRFISRLLFCSEDNLQFHFYICSFKVCGTYVAEHHLAYFMFVKLDAKLCGIFIFSYAFLYKFICCYMLVACTFKPMIKHLLVFCVILTPTLLTGLFEMLSLRDSSHCVF